MILCSAIRGRVGDRVYKTYGDKLVVTRVPRFDGHVPSVAQRQRREKLRAATAYAQAVYADPAAKAVYVVAAKQLGRQPFRLAVSDFLRGRPRVMLHPAIPKAANDANDQPAPATPRVVSRPPVKAPPSRVRSDFSRAETPRRRGFQFGRLAVVSVPRSARGFTLRAPPSRLHGFRIRHPLNGSDWKIRWWYVFAADPEF